MGRPRTRVKRTCLQCGKTFETHPSQIKRGGGKFCSTGCGTRYRNLTNNPSKREEVRRKISENHADVSGENNPMYGRRGPLAPSWRGGRKAIGGDIWRRIALTNKPPVCEVCGKQAEGRKLHVHHIDKDHNNNDLSNLQVVCSWCHNNVIHKRKRDHLGRFTSEEVV